MPATITNPKLLAALLSVAAIAPLLTACDKAQHTSAESILTTLGASPLPAALTVTTDTPQPDALQPSTSAPVASSDPPPLQYGDPGYVCTPVFRLVSCDDQGKPHDLDAQMNWIN